MSNVADKIRKILAVAESNNPNEAMTALLKAREVMARYKVSESDLKKNSGHNQLTMSVYMGNHFTENTNSWFVRLGQIIAENHCCTVVVRPVNNRKVMHISFAGINEDPYIAREVFAYAVQHIKRNSRKYKKEISQIIFEDNFGNYKHLEQKVVIKKTKTWESSYVTGFIRGLTYQYEIQFKSNDDEENLALALIPDPKVVELKEHIDKKADRKIREDTTDQSAIIKGYKDGCEFDLNRKKPVANITEGVQSPDKT